MARSAEHGAAAVLAALLLLAAQPAVQQGTSIQLPCTTSDDCDTQGAVCSAGLCTCASGQVMTSDLTRCLPGAGEWGAACSDAVQCVSRLLVGGSCSPAEVITSALAPPQPAANVCQCAQGYHYLRGQCWRSAGLGESCKHSENCYANHDSESVTCQDSKCVCAAGFYQREYSSCRRISTEYGQECGIDQDCQYEFSACPDRKCACQTGYKFDKTAKKCSPAPKAPRLESRAALDEADEVAPAVAWQALFGTKKAVSKRAAVGDDLPAAAACTSASDCGAHSDCESGACVCQRGYFKLDGETTCHPELLQTCAQDTDCTMKYAICRASGDTKACSCKGGYIASKDMRICRKMSRALAWSCLHDEQCGYFGPGASCESKRCACAAGTHWVQAQKYCWVSRAVGEQCSAPEDCAGLGEGGECGWSNADGEVQGDGGASACRCGDGFHAAADGASCRVNADGVGARCEQDEDCVTAHTACAANACACVAGYTTDASGKGCQTGVGGPCAADSDCAAAGSQCVQSKCACPDGRVPSKSGDACLNSVVTLNGTCTETAQCALLNAQCTEGACQCDEDQHFRDGRCQRKTGLGERCATTSECYLAEDPERAECRNGLCKCGFQFTNVDNKECSGSSAASGRAAAASMSVLAAACVSLSLGRGG